MPGGFSDALSWSWSTYTSTPVSSLACVIDSFSCLSSSSKILSCLQVYLSSLRAVGHSGGFRGGSSGAKEPPFAKNVKTNYNDLPNCVGQLNSIVPTTSTQPTVVHLSRIPTF